MQKMFISGGFDKINNFLILVKTDGVQSIVLR